MDPSVLYEFTIPRKWEATFCSNVTNMKMEVAGCSKYYHNLSHYTSVTTHKKFIV